MDPQQEAFMGMMKTMFDNISNMMKVNTEMTTKVIEMLNKTSDNSIGGQSVVDPEEFHTAPEEPIPSTSRSVKKRTFDSVAVKKKRTQSESIAIKREAQKKLIDDNGEDLIEKLKVYGNMYERGNLKFKHSFVGTNVAEAFIEYHQGGDYGFIVLPFICDHLSKNFREHTHMVYAYRIEDERKFLMRQSNFSRWCKRNKGICPEKKNNSIEMNNIVHLINTCLYIQTKKTISCNDGCAEHTNFRYTNLIFENDAEKMSFKNYQIDDAFPNFLDLQTQYYEEYQAKKRRMTSPLNKFNGGDNHLRRTRTEEQDLDGQELYLRYNDSELEAMGYYNKEK